MERREQSQRRVQEKYQPECTIPAFLHLMLCSTHPQGKVTSINCTVSFQAVLNSHTERNRLFQSRCHFQSLSQHTAFLSFADLITDETESSAAETEFSAGDAIRGSRGTAGCQGCMRQTSTWEKQSCKLQLQASSSSSRPPELCSLSQQHHSTGFHQTSSSLHF